MLNAQHSCIKAGHFALHSIIEYHMWEILKTCSAYIAYYKSIIKSLYLFMQGIIKQEHTRCR